MITAHLASGYITGRCLKATGPVMGAALLGSIFPDFDFIWSFLIDHGAFHHHHYWVHVPAFWAAVSLIGLPLLHVLRPAWMRVAGAFLAGILVHLSLDTVAGDIKWLWPYSNEFFKFINIPSRYPHWILNFVLHPVFLLEIAIWILAIGLWFQWPRRQEV